MKWTGGHFLFIGSRHINMARRHLKRNKNSIICGMKELLETMPRIELALLIIGAFVLMISIILGYAMINEYKMYLEDHLRARFSLSDFLKRERFYIYLLLVSIFIMLLNLLYFLE